MEKEGVKSMATTFTDKSGNVVDIVARETFLRTDTDVVSGEVSRYIIEVEDILYEVDSQTYQAVEKFINK